MSAELGENIRRWSTKKRSALVLSIVKGETSVVEAARTRGPTIAHEEAQKDRFLLGVENTLRRKPRNDEALREEEIKRPKRKIDDLVMDIDILKEEQKPYLPTTPGTHDE